MLKSLGKCINFVRKFISALDGINRIRERAEGLIGLLVLKRCQAIIVMNAY